MRERKRERERERKREQIKLNAAATVFFYEIPKLKSTFSSEGACQLAWLGRQRLIEKTDKKFSCTKKWKKRKNTLNFIVIK